MTLKIKRLDHHGIVSGIIDDLGLVGLIDEHLPQDEKQEITPGEAIKGMIMNGLGFSNRPLSLTPQFFTNLPMEHLFRKGVEASHFNRHKLGRTLDQSYAFGCESLFALLSQKVCLSEQVNTRFQSLDSTAYALTGDYKKAAESGDDVPIHITHGYTKDHRPDLKQVVQEMIVSQDGGIPLACKNWDGNASDNKIFRERSKALITSFKASKEEQYCIADSKLYHKKNSEFLSQILFITRIPSTNKEEKQIIADSLSDKQWTVVDQQYKFCEKQIEHMDIKQRWLVVHSTAARERAQKTISRQVKKSQHLLEKALFHLQAQRFACEADTQKALDKLAKKQKFHTLVKPLYQAHAVYKGKGRPKANAAADSFEWQVTAEFELKQEAVDSAIEQKSCFVLGTNAKKSSLSTEDILTRYKAQSCVERGFRFLKDPLFFVSSLFIKKPSRIDALLMIMTLSLLIYSIAQRRLRATMKQLNATVPNQINQPKATPTLRWIFQCFEGINILQTTKEYIYKTLNIDGMDELRKRIISYLGDKVGWLYLNQNYCRQV